MRRKHIFSLVALSFLILFPSMQVHSTHADAECTQLVEENCLACHSETRICQKIAKQRGKRAWKRTIKTMIRHGAEIEKADKNMLSKCLSMTGMPVPELCQKK